MEWLEIMRELLRTTDLVRLSWCRALLADSRIGTVVLDTHTSVIEGSIGAIPRRLMVSDEDYDEAVRLLAEAGEQGGARDRGIDRRTPRVEQGHDADEGEDHEEEGDFKFGFQHGVPMRRERDLRARDRSHSECQL